MADPAPVAVPFSWQRGRVIVHLRDDHREALGVVIGAYRRALTEDVGELLWRLRPPAHPDDPEAEAAYRELVGDDLDAQRLRDLGTLEDTIDSDELDDEAAASWTRTLTGCRLMLAGREDLDVTDTARLYRMDPDDPGMLPSAFFDWVGYLLEGLIAAAQQGLDEAG